MKKKNGIISQICDELMTFFENVITPYMDKEFGQVNGRLGKVENRLDGVENRLDKVEDELHGVKTELIYVKNDVRDLKADTPTQKEVNNHDRRLLKLEKLHQKPLPAFA